MVILLYLIPIFGWSFSWYVIKFQLGTVDPSISVAYRFILSGILLFGFAKLLKKDIRLKKQDYGFVLLLGITLYSFNYWIFYLSEQYLTSSIPAIVFSTVIFFNSLNGRIFLKTPIEKKILFGGLLGFVGIILVFYQEISIQSIADPTSTNEKWWGLILAILGTIIASWGNILSKHNQNRKTSIWSMNAHGMLFGGLLMFGFSLLTGNSPQVEWTTPYLLSFTYLVVFASVFAFGAYHLLIGRIGATRSAYIFFITPVGATLTSFIFEGTRFNLYMISGVVLILIGIYFTQKK